MALHVIMKKTKILPNFKDLKWSVINCILPLHILFYSFLYKNMDKRHKNAMKHSTLKVSQFFLCVNSFCTFPSKISSRFINVVSNMYSLSWALNNKGAWADIFMATQATFSPQPSPLKGVLPRYLHGWT